MLKYLFVCVHNAGRSQMAEAFVNHYASLHGLPVKGFSAGTLGGKALNPVSVQAMLEVGIDMSGQAPKVLTQDMLGQDVTAITMGCGVDAEACPARFIVSDDWGLNDPAGQDLNSVRAIRDQIDTRVQKLLGLK
jgi:arsenate reductase